MGITNVDITQIILLLIMNILILTNILLTNISNMNKIVRCLVFWKKCNLGNGSKHMEMEIEKYKRLYKIDWKGQRHGMV